MKRDFGLNNYNNTRYKDKIILSCVGFLRRQVVIKIHLQNDANFHDFIIANYFPRLICWYQIESTTTALNTYFKIAI